LSLNKTEGNAFVSLFDGRSFSTPLENLSMCFLFQRSPSVPPQKKSAESIVLSEQFWTYCNLAYWLGKMGSFTFCFLAERGKWIG
jgi:hypothetical protein